MRAWRKNPGSTAVAIIALALGIGANSGIFSVINGILLRPLPYKDPQNLVVLWNNNVGKGMRQQPVSPLDFRDFASQQDVFDGMAALRVRPANLTGGELPERVETAEVSPGIFELLGAQASLGRTFGAQEDQPGKNHVAVLSDGLWRRTFGGAPDILGKKLILDGLSYTVVGVAAPRFRLLDTDSELWIPYTPDPKELAPNKRALRVLKAIARLKPGLTAPRALDEMRTIAHRLEQQYPDTNGGYSIDMVSLDDQLIGDIRPTLWALIGAVAFVLLIACANVANLLLARAGAREKEIAVRTALGASPTWLLRQLLTESLLLSLIASIAGVVLAYWGVSILVRLAPANIPRVREISIDWRVLAFTLVVSLITGLIFGLAPALASIRADLNSVLKSGGRGTSGSRSRGRMQDVLVVSEIVFCVVLLIGTGLLLRSFARLQQVNPGFRSDHLLTIQLALPENRYSGMRVALFYKQLIQRVETLPGVESAAVARNLPLSGSDASANFQIEHQTYSGSDQPRAKYRSSSAGYFSAMGIPLLKGRFFDRSDDERTPHVVVINQAAARRFWSNEEPVGKRIRSGFDEEQWSTIVGVVGNVKHAGLEAGTEPEIYYQYLQIPSEEMNFVEGSMTLVIRTAADPAAMTSSVRNEVRQLDPVQPVFNVATMDELVHGSMAQPRFRTLLLGVFAGIALVLTAIGLYGVMAYSVAQRTNELGVRTALGAQPDDILRLVVGHGARLATIGIGIGIIFGVAVARILSGLLFGVSTLDPVALGFTSILILAVALIGSYIPALRAAKVDPVTALRTE